MSLYNDNIVPIDGAATARKVQEHMAQSDYVARKLDELAEITGAMDLDDVTSRQIVKFQARLQVQQMFEKIQLAMGTITEAELAQSSLKDRTGLIVGLTGRIDTLMNLIQRISEQDGSDMDQFISKLRSMERQDAIVYLRKEFASLFETLFTDDERGQLFKDLEEHVDLDLLGTDHADNVRGSSDGQKAGSARWVSQSRPSSILPPAR